MRYIVICLLCLTFCRIEVLSFGDSGESTEISHPNPAHSQPYGIDDTLWAEHLDTFKKRLPTDPSAARTELQNIAKKLFGKHTLAEEWVPLYFRLSREGTEHLSDLKRVSELEIRMLIDINAQTYAKQIQHHREILAHYDELAKNFEDSGRPTPETHKQEEQKEPSKTEKGLDTKTGYEHYKTFHELLPTDPSAARAELTAFSVLAFHGHPLTKEWEELFFRLSREKEATVPEMLRLFELKKQMLEDHSPEKHAKEIENLETAIKDLKSVSRLLKLQGTLDTQKMPFNFNKAPPK